MWGRVSVSDALCPGEAQAGHDCLKGGGEGRGDTHDPPPTGAGGQALPCDPPEGDPGKEGGAGFRARILVERKHGVGREREMKDPTSPPSQTDRSSSKAPAATLTPH